MPDAWQVQIQAQIQVKARVLIKNSFMPPTAIRAAHLETDRRRRGARPPGARRRGPGATLCVLPQGPQTIPYLQ